MHIYNYYQDLKVAMLEKIPEPAITRLLKNKNNNYGDNPGHNVSDDQN